jgi:hypothetical protein
VVTALCAGSVAFWWQRRMEAGVDPARVPLAAMDSYNYYHPLFQYAFDELRAGRLAFWSPYEHAGAPLFATAQHGLLYPPNLLYLLGTAIGEKSLGLFHLTVAAVGTAALARACRQSWLGAVTAGIAFALAPAVTGLVFFPDHLHAVAWMPWLLVVLHRVLVAADPWRWGLLLGACAALQYLGGYPQYCLLSVYALTAYLLWHEWGSWRTVRGRAHLRAAVTALAAGGVLAISLTGPQLLPNWELSRLSIRGWSALTIDQAALQSADPVTSFLRALLPMYRTEEVLPSLYVVPPLLVLAVLGAAAPAARFFLGMTVVAWLLACGIHTPLFRLFFALPGGASFRIPTRFFTVAALAFAVVVGAGADALWRGRIEGRRVRALAWALVVLAMVLLVVARLDVLPAHLERAGVLPPPLNSFMNPAETAPRLVRALAWHVLASAGWLLVWVAATPSLRRVWVAAVPLLVYATLFVATRNTAPFPVTHPDLHVLPPAAVTFLRDNQGYDRTYIAYAPWPMPGRHLPAKAGLLHRIYGLNDRENVYSRRFADLVARMAPPLDERAVATLAALHIPAYVPQGEVRVSVDSPNIRLLDLFGVRFVVEGPGTPFDAARAPGRFVPAFEADGVRISINTEAFPRAFVVHRTETVAEPARALERVVDPDVDLRTTAILEREPPRQLPARPASATTAQIVRYAPDEVVVDVSGSEPGILVLTDQNYPGWEAEIDGRPAEILVADYIFRAVPVEAGAHQVVFRFVPRTFWQGLLVAGLGTTLLVGASLVRRPPSLS